MSTNIIDLVNDAALEIGDPNKERVSLAQWTSIYNRSNRELCQKANVLRFQDEFDLLALDPDTGEVMRKYPYPEGMVVMRGIHASETPSDSTTMKWLGEKFEDEFRRWTSGMYPVASLPTHYFSTASWLYLVPAVTADIAGGACIDYFGLPDRISDVQSGVVQVPDFAQDYLIRRMVIFGDMARNRIVEARAGLELWNADMEGLQDKLSDRSDDRRASLGPRRRRLEGMR